jgi:hypothetical protein
VVLDGDLATYSLLYLGFEMLLIEKKHSNVIHGTSINFNYGRNIMDKFYCKTCSQYLDLKEFYTDRLSQCIKCKNRKRRDSYKKSICRHCNIDFRPGIEGRYKFCSEKCRFMAKVLVDRRTNCWNWQGCITLRGYGCFVPSDGRKSALAHRESYRIFYGNLDDNKIIIHSCDNTKCVNPEHLRLGTPQENREDAQKKGRLKMPERLTKEHVINIRKLYHEGVATDILAKMYKRTQGTIMDIVYRVSWKEI